MVYDYRHELIELLNHTASDPESLLQTQRSLTIIVDLLNQLQPVKEPTSTEKQSAKPGYQIRRNVTAPKISLGQLINQTAVPTPKPHETPAKPQLNKQPERSTAKAAANQAYLRDIPVTAKNEAPAEPAAAPELSEVELLARDNCYPVHRLLSGAEINHRFYSESILHKLPFPINDGDVVQLDRQRLIHGKLPVINRVTNDHLAISTTPTKVIEYATLEPVAGSDVLQIKKTLKGNSILDESHANTIVIDPYKYASRNLKPGMIIDFAYYDHGNGMRDAKAGEIRWIHSEHEFDTTKAPRKLQQPKKVKKTRHEYSDKLDYDLNQKRVLVVTGARDRVQDLKAVVAKHHGVFYSLDASMEENVSSSKIKRAVKDADLIVVCIDRIHHRISQLTTHHAKRNDRPFAIAATTSNTAVERAIFRALNGNNAYESSGQDMAKYVSAD